MCQYKDSAEDAKRIGWVHWLLRTYSRSKASFWLFYRESNSRICCCDLGHDWQRSQLVHQVHIQGHGNVWVSYHTGTAWRHLVFLIRDEKKQILLRTMKDVRKDIAAKLFNKHIYPFSIETAFLFPEKKNICQDQMVNSQNNFSLVFDEIYLPSLQGL